MSYNSETHFSPIWPCVHKILLAITWQDFKCAGFTWDGNGPNFSSPHQSLCSYWRATWDDLSVNLYNLYSCPLMHLFNVPYLEGNNPPPPTYLYECSLFGGEYPWPIYMNVPYLKGIPVTYLNECTLFVQDFHAWLNSASERRNSPKTRCRWVLQYLRVPLFSSVMSSFRLIYEL